MKKRFNGKYAGNAETEIDYITGKVTFKHPEKTKNINENLAYFIHNLADIFGLMLGYVFFFIVSFYYKNNIIKNLKFLPLWLSMLISLIMILYLLSMIVVGLIITGYLSVFIHKNNKK